MRAGDEQTVNDVHSRLNATRVVRIVRPRDLDDLRTALRDARDQRQPVAICGGRHAMGGQQFGTDALLIDMSAMNRTHRFDAQRGFIEIDAGADWPAVIRAIHQAQPDEIKRWSIRQKQTGADALTLGGAVASNVHGRGLLMRPFVDDVESLTLVTPDAQVLSCSRSQNAALFALVIGGYGLFGAVATVTLRLGVRLKLRRLVDILDIDDAVGAFDRRIREGCLYGDFQYSIDPTDDGFLRRGVMACYAPVGSSVPISDSAADLNEGDWLKLLALAHDDKRRAFEIYSAHYLASHGRLYWSDTMQLSTYIPTYDQFLRSARPRTSVEESLVIGEQFVPRDRLLEFLSRARRALRRAGVENIYGTIRFIRRDQTTFLPWARDDYACVIFNLRTTHDGTGIARTASAFRALNDAAIGLGGGFYLTYHRFATREQIEACYPNFREFLRLKRAFDPQERFVSNWYRHHRALFAGGSDRAACRYPAACKTQRAGMIHQA